MDQITIVHYIRQHLFDSIRVENIAKEFFMNCPYLSAKFKEAGETLTDFIWKEKNGGSKTPPPLLRQIIQFYRS